MSDALAKSSPAKGGPAALRKVDRVIRILGDVLLIGGLLLAFRVYLFDVFWSSGVTKITDVETQMDIFASDPEVNFYGYNMGEILAPIPVSLSFWAATLTELVAAALVLVGLYARYAAVPIMVVAVVIQFVLGGRGGEYAQYQVLTEFLWLFAASLVVALGPGFFSLDRLLDRVLKRDKPLAPDALNP